MNESSLPPQESFNSILRNEACSDEDYNRALDVWEAFHFQTFQEYHEHYLACMRGSNILFSYLFEIFKANLNGLNLFL